MQPKFTRVEGVGIVMQSSRALVRQVSGNPTQLGVSRPAKQRSGLAEFVMISVYL